MKHEGAVPVPNDFSEKWPRWIVREDGLPWYRMKNGSHSRGMWIICETCGHVAPAHHYHSGRFCSQPCAYAGRGGDKHWNWKGGVHPDPDGYVRVSTSTGRRPEHCVVMEEHLGRPLYPEERVHHNNGVKDDNRPENLELWLKGHPPGQRVDDLLDWVTEHYEEELIDRLMARGKLVL